MTGDERVDDEKTFYRGEAAIAICFDFQDFAEVAAGGVLTAPVVVVSSGNAALAVFGVPVVLTADFEEKDRDGTVMKTVPSGKGVKAACTFPLVGGIKGECIATCTVKVNGGPPANPQPGKRLKIIVK